MYDYSGLPEGLQGGMKRYVEKGIRPGGFLTACLENDLVGAVHRADDTNRPLIQDIVSWIYWEVPIDCWGNKEKVAKWPFELLRLKAQRIDTSCTKGC